MQVIENYSDTKYDNSRPAVVRTHNLSKKFKKAVAVNNVELQVEAGDVFGLLGPNGAGKTTLIRMLLGLITPSSGRVEVFGFDPVGQRAQVLRRVAAIVEAPALYPGLTGRDNLRAMAMVAGVNNPRKIEEVLEKIHLVERANDKYASYSLGMKQRLCLAATLLTDPQLIILDEPTNGLDPAGMAEIRQLIKELVEQGRTVFLSSHLLNEVQQVCNRVAVIQRGQVIVQGLVSELLGGKKAIQLKLQPDEWGKACFLLQQNGFANQIRMNGEYLLVQGVTNAGSEINRLLATNGIFAAEISPKVQSLEEYYLELTNGQVEPALVESAGGSK